MTLIKISITIDRIYNDEFTEEEIERIQGVINECCNALECIKKPSIVQDISYKLLET